jgi:hypothetical protein
MLVLSPYRPGPVANIVRGSREHPAHFQGRQPDFGTQQVRRHRPRVTESPWVLWRLCGLEQCGVSDVALGMGERLKLGRWHVVDGAVEAPTIPPVDPLCSGELHLLKGTPGSALADQLGLVRAVDCLRSMRPLRLARQGLPGSVWRLPLPRLLRAAMGLDAPRVKPVRRRCACGLVLNRRAGEWLLSPNAGVP